MTAQSSSTLAFAEAIERELVKLLAANADLSLSVHDPVDQLREIRLSVAEIFAADSEESQEAKRHIEELRLGLDDLRQRLRPDRESGDEAAEVLAGCHAVGHAVEVGAGGARLTLECDEQVLQLIYDACGRGFGHGGDSSTSGRPESVLTLTVEVGLRRGSDSCPCVSRGGAS